MPLTPWSMSKLQQCRKRTGSHFNQDALTLATVNKDFGQLAEGQAVAVLETHTLEELQRFLTFANKEALPVTLRAQGLSQSGQSLTPCHGVSVNVSSLNNRLQWTSNTSIRAGCSVSFKEILYETLKKGMAPIVYPYNTNLSVGGVLSAGGVGACSFREGIIGAHVRSLHVIRADGSLVYCSSQNQKTCFDACLAGNGLFGVIYDAELILRPVKARVTTVLLDYKDPAAWIKDQFGLPDAVNYLESVCLLDGQKKPQYQIALSLEHDDKAVNLECLAHLHYSQCVSTQDMSMETYVFRHDPRFIAMKEQGLWDCFHPWYECYVPAEELIQVWDRLIAAIDLSLGGVYHVFPIAPRVPEYFMRPSDEQVVTFNILSPGIVADQLPDALASLSKINTLLLGVGGRRYISGWFEKPVGSDYWKKHYGDSWSMRQQIKQELDPHGIFCSHLFTRGLFNETPDD